MQPLDTHAFLPFKLRLRQKYQDAQACNADGEVGVEELVRCVCVAIRTVLQGQRWASAFDKDGLGVAQAGASQRVLDALQLEGPLRIPSTRPTEGQLALCFPRRSTIPTDLIWRQFIALPGGLREACDISGDGEALVDRGPRTRAEHRRAIAAPGAAAPVVAPEVGGGADSRLRGALARGRPALVARGRRLLPSRGRGRGGGK